MKILFGVLLASLLAGCLADLPTATRPGTGIVQEVRRSPGDSPSRAAQTGGQYPSGYYVWVRMEDGSVQTVQSVSGAFARGDRVRLTPEGRLEKIPE